MIDLVLIDQSMKQVSIMAFNHHLMKRPQSLSYLFIIILLANCYIITLVSGQSVHSNHDQQLLNEKGNEGPLYQESKPFYQESDPLYQESKPKEYLNQFAVNIDHGPDADRIADQLASRYGFVNKGKVCIKTDSNYCIKTISNYCIKTISNDLAIVS